LQSRTYLSSPFIPYYTHIYAALNPFVAFSISCIFALPFLPTKQYCFEMPLECAARTTKNRLKLKKLTHARNHKLYTQRDATDNTVPLTSARELRNHADCIATEATVCIALLTGLLLVKTSDKRCDFGLQRSSINPSMDRTRRRPFSVPAGR